MSVTFECWHCGGQEFTQTDKWQWRCAKCDSSRVRVVKEDSEEEETNETD